ncbi:MAG TPA: hypothetical protein VFE16_09960 [Candidatus Cybelea sp.]|nr:hypothetical protein [Candidatus Cybelea sp.]
MNIESIAVRFATLLCAAGMLASCTGTPQSFAPAAQAPLRPAAALVVTTGDEASARDARILSAHFMPLRTRGGRAAEHETRKKYPADLVRKKGPVMTAAASFNIYVNCKTGGETCWGDPEGFQRALTGSTFAALLQQYTKSGPSSYTFGGAFAVKYHSYTKLFYANDLLSVVHAALEKNGGQAGYATIYHVFLPKGTDTCFDRSRSCYSPDHPRTFNFCAYHESVAFKDVADEVIVSIEPYQMIDGCASRASAGASALTNSTSSTLGHETFESITDPGPAFAWFNFTFFDEVADLCETFEWKIAVGGTAYSLQPMYSNKYHACADGP